MDHERFFLYALDKHSRIVRKDIVKKVEVKIETEKGDYYEQFHPGGEVKAIKLEEIKAGDSDD